jgi:hypothetical protein
MKLIRKLYGHGQNGLILTSTEAIPGSSSVDTQLLTSGKQENTTANYSCYHPWFHKSCTLVDQVILHGNTANSDFSISGLSNFLFVAWQEREMGFRWALS